MTTTIRTLAQARKVHGVLDVRAKRAPVHLEKSRGVYRPTDRARCELCCKEARGLEVARLKARIAELERAR